MDRGLSTEEQGRLREANAAYLRKDYEAAHAILSVLSVDHPHNEAVQFGFIKCLVKRGEGELAKVVCGHFLKHTESEKIRSAYIGLGGKEAPKHRRPRPATPRWRFLANAVIVCIALAAVAGFIVAQPGFRSLMTDGAPRASATEPPATLEPAIQTAAIVPIPSPETVVPREPAAAAPASTPPSPIRTSRGNPPPFTKEVKWTEREFTAWTTSWGEYLEYRPKNVRRNPQVIVIAHGSVTDDEHALTWAQNYIQRARWMAVAERTGHIIVSPVFDRTRYTRYNRLQGGPAGPDGFVLAIVDSYSDYERPFFLYGHSAGGQFTHRFLLTHPHRVERAVVSAAGNYAFPDPEVAWPYGMKNAPNPNGWLTATRVPLTIVVGSRDTTQNPTNSPHQHGNTRIELAQNWVAWMHQYAARHGNPNCTFQVVVVPGTGHASAGIVNTSANHLLPPERYQAQR